MGPRHREARRDEVERNDRALLDAARAVLAEDGRHATVATIAARAGVGIGTLYRRYPTKERLFQHLCLLALRDYLAAAEAGLAEPDPWTGFATYVRRAVLAGTGALAPIAGTVEVTEEMATLNRRGDAVAAAVIQRAHDAGVLRRDVTDVDVALLIEQLGRSPLVEQLSRQGRDDLLHAAAHARERLIHVVLDGLRTGRRTPLPAPAPDWSLFTERWTTLS